RDGLVKTNSDALARQFALALRANPTFSWMSYSDEEGNFSGAFRTLDGALRVSQSVIHAGKGQLREHTGGPAGDWTPYLSREDYEYDPRTEPFYIKAKEARQRIWYGPYIFYDEAVPGITCASPLLAADGRLLGVFTVDFNLNFLAKIVADLRFGRRGRVF